MATIVGSGMLLFEPVENWEKLPPGWEFIDVAGVAVDSKGDVYVVDRLFNRAALIVGAGKHAKKVQITRRAQIGDDKITAQKAGGL